MEVVDHVLGKEWSSELEGAEVTVQLTSDWNGERHRRVYVGAALS